MAHGGGVDAQAARTLDDHVVALAGPGPQQAGGDGAHGAVDRPQQVVVQLVGHPEEGMTRRQVQVVGVGGGEEGPRARRRIVTVHAPVGVALEALVAVVAGEDRRVDHPVALPDGSAGRVGGHAVAQHFYDPGALVAHGTAGGRQRHVHLIAAPDVQVGTADTRLGHPQHYRPGLWFGDFIFLDYEGLAVFLAGNYSAFHGVLLMAVVGLF